MNTSQNLRHLSTREFTTLGMQDFAYVRPVTVDGASAFGAFAADGTPLGAMETRELAFAALKQHDLEPVSVH
jgi:hypothetical protein